MEIAVRTALGASRSALIRQFLSESLLLGAVAGAAGLLLAYLLVRAVRAVAGGILPRVAAVHIDGTAVLFTIAMTLLTTLVFGLAPALHAARRNLATAMRSAGRSSGSRRALQLRDSLVVGQVALSLVLLVGAGLLLRSLAKVQDVDPGFDSTRLLTAQIPLAANEYPERADVERFWTGFLERVRALPGVTAAAGTGLLPMRGVGDALYYVEGHPPASEADKRDAMVSVVTDDYFRTMRIPIFAGRPLGPEDRTSASGSAAGPRDGQSGGAESETTQGNVVISTGMAETLFPGENPLGRRLVVGSFIAEIVGVAGDVHTFGQEADARDMLYFSQHQRRSFMGFSLVARTTGDPTNFVPASRELVHRLDPDLPLSNIETMDEILHDSIASSYFRARLLFGFALVALVLAVIGLYGVLAYSVRQRTREIGVRIALGARASDIIRSVVARGMLLVGIGLVIGVAGALGATRLIAGMLFQTGSTDPLVFVAVSAVILMAGLLACLLPARRAVSIAPTTALKT